jgi:protein-tyrosine phosphatase
VLDGGPTRLAAPSTIVRVNGAGWTIVREGVYDERALQRMVAVNVLLVCTGNTCRSPMAAALFEHALRDRLGGDAGALAENNITVTSAGVAAGSGARPSDHAIEVMAQRGIDVSGHRSRALSLELINRADYIFVMTQGHLDSVVQMAPSARERCRLLCDQDVEDPIGGSAEVYAACAGQLEAGVRARLNEVDL